ncbi:PAS domain S-box protein [Clostridium sp. AM58-1XD]|nr:PAS domain S-box protein [Clostridium sp. AM58-1XD]
MRRLQEGGTEAFVGGNSLYKKAEKLGIPAVMLGFGRESVNKCVDEAIRAVEIRRSEQAKSARIQTIMDYTFEGILSTDVEGRITMANQYAQNILAALGEELAGKRITQYFESLPIQNVLKKGERFLSEMYQLERMVVSVNCVPLVIRGAIIGSVTTFQDITQIQEEEEKIRKQLHQKGFVVKYKFENIICSDSKMMETVRMAEKFANSDSNLFIYGETGTGKELFAQSIHNASSRKSGPFVAINCAALPENLLESELFGYVEGAFTGAVKGGKKGLFELAHNGTIFLDEIGDMSLKLQARLLRVIQEREIMRLGDDRVLPVNVRVISASNKELYQEVEKGEFREDLLYRLNVLCLSVPPLRERGNDILILMEYYIEKTRSKTNCILHGIDQEARKEVLQYDWPGNVRELRNFCERLSVICDRQTAGKKDVMAALYGGRAHFPRERMEYGTEERIVRGFGSSEKEELMEALKRCNYSRKRTAATLGIDTSTLYRKIKKYGIHL